MKATIDTAGRLVIPREIWRQAGLEPGMVLDVRCSDGRIEIEPVPLEVRLVKEGRFLVAVPEDSTEPLTDEAVHVTLDALRDSRA
jgi:AbrB family looped-hinge helix DNA binding protein